MGAGGDLVEGGGGQGRWWTMAKVRGRGRQGATIFELGVSLSRSPQRSGGSGGGSGGGVVGPVLGPHRRLKGQGRVRGNQGARGVGPGGFVGTSRDEEASGPRGSWEGGQRWGLGLVEGASGPKGLGFVDEGSGPEGLGFMERASGPTMMGVVEGAGLLKGANSGEPPSNQPNTTHDLIFLTKSSRPIDPPLGFHEPSSIELKE
ncbi:hypothetical protein Salat_0672000 [Sesamum alatum]|uniref:Uncharacterized protein n=1 Tax=Sesamum alatum TaxID=300844 RepID=A0AAE1YRZ8_9LAMI|nr:hypothetical protein Salat_0672000 [Sesamum alatum]